VSGWWLLFVSVALERGLGLFCCWLVCWCWWRIVLLRDFSTLQVKQGVYGGLTISQDATQFPPPPVSGAENFTERDGLTREFSTDGAAQKLIFVEDANFCHVPRIKP
jgi:hypothetical protein